MKVKQMPVVANVPEIITNIVEKTANPAPLGLMAFALTTILLNLHNAGYIPLDAMIVGMGLFYGGLAQVIAGFMEWKKNNTFGETAFLSYGFFWLSLVAIWLLPKMGLANAPSATTMGYYLFVWGIFTFGLFIMTLKLSKSLQIIFAALVLLFFLLSIADFTGNEGLKVLAGYEGIVCGLLAMYTSLAQILNEVSGRKVLPV